MTFWLRLTAYAFEFCPAATYQYTIAKDKVLKVKPHSTSEIVPVRLPRLPIPNYCSIYVLLPIMDV